MTSRQRNYVAPLKMLARLICFVGLLVVAAAGKACNPGDLNQIDTSQCPESQLCDETTLTCVCQPGYRELNETHCAPLKRPTATPNHSSLVASHSSGSIVAGILIPLVLILLVIYAVYLNRKYDLVSWVRRKLHQRSSNYDEFMIGQEPDDDPPLGYA